MIRSAKIGSTLIRYLLLCTFLLTIPLAGMAQGEAVLYNGTKLTIEKCLELAQQKEQQGDKKEATRFLNWAANMHWEKKEYTSAIQYFEKSLQLNQSIGNDNGISMINNNLGMIYADIEKYETSLRYFEQTLQSRKITQEKLGIISALVNIAVVLNNLKRHAEAAQRLEEALKYAIELNDLPQIRSCYGMLSETYEKANNHEKSVYYFNLYRSFHEMEQKTKESRYLQDIEKSRLSALLAEAEKKNKELALFKKEQELQSNQQQLKHTEEELTQLDKATQKLVQNATKQELAIRVLERENEIKALNSKKDKEKLEHEKSIKNIFGAGLGIIVLFSGALLFNYNQKRKKNIRLAQQNAQISQQRSEILSQKESMEAQNVVLEGLYKEVQKKNEHITSSINYAKMIQAALLPSAERQQRLLPDSFVLFRPRDIVSGDFYWMNEKDNKIIIIAADCTGHGVPGAFMSMIGVNLLNQINSRMEPEPALMLQELHREITIALHKKETDNKDGMDIALYVIDKAQNTITFAGAKNPLVYIQNGEMTLLKGDRLTVGGHYDEQEHIFTRVEINLSVPTWLYMYSDGFPDQFGGEKGEKKFSSKRLQELILQHHTQPMADQQQFFDATLTEWMGTHKQIDDILLIGARLEPYSSATSALNGQSVNDQSVYTHLLQ